MTVESYELLDQVNDEQSFLRFTRALPGDTDFDFGASQGLEPSSFW